MTEKKEKPPEYADIQEVLHFIQKTLKAPKGQLNKHGNYHYRSCEDIVEAVKLIAPAGVTIKLLDDVVMVGNRFYIKATASLCFKGSCESATAFAREPDEQKGMQAAQLTGATSSYARKYALNGLFMIDDTKDADATNDHGKEAKAEKPKAEPKPAKTPQQEWLAKAKRELEALTDYSLIVTWQNQDETKTMMKDLNLAQVKWLQDIINQANSRLSTLNAG